MALKYQIFILVALLMAITGANATNNYSIMIGVHEVTFNTSSSFFENGFKTTYSPVMPGDFGLDYTHSATTLWNDTKPFLTIIVRDFKSPIPENAYFLESNTLDEFMSYLPLGNRLSTHNIGNPIVNGGYVGGIVRDHENEYFGALMAWPSDQIEIIIIGSLPSIEIWNDISKSIELVI